MSCKTPPNNPRGSERGTILINFSIASLLLVLIVLFLSLRHFTCVDLALASIVTAERLLTKSCHWESNVYVHYSLLLLMESQSVKFTIVLCRACRAGHRFRRTCVLAVTAGWTLKCLMGSSLSLQMVSKSVDLSPLAQSMTDLGFSIGLQWNTRIAYDEIQNGWWRREDGTFVTTGN